ncbi:MAG: dephospho-CoA kinase [Planctomycetes bacterium]|nr:dephospho-CoA kinase [Planctomycetota bacterium]
MASSPKPIIGLAGGIGAGKSTVARQLASLGALVIDADAIAKAALDLDDVKRELRAWWGDEVIDAAGRVDRKAVARRVFDHPTERKRLEGLIHPIVAAERDRLIAAGEADPAVKAIVLDVPLLFEVGLDQRCDRVVFVDADRATRLRRVAARGWDAAEMDRREKNQWPLDRKLQLAHDIIDNTISEADCFSQVQALLRRILDSTMHA